MVLMTIRTFQEHCQMMKEWQSPRPMRFITALVSQEAKNLSGLYRGVAIHWSVSYWPLVLSPRAPSTEAIEEQLPSAGDRSAVLDDLERIEELNLLGDVRLEGAANVVARFSLTHWRQHLSNAGRPTASGDSAAHGGQGAATLRGMALSAQLSARFSDAQKQLEIIRRIQGATASRIGTLTQPASIRAA